MISPTPLPIHQLCISKVVVTSEPFRSHLEYTRSVQEHFLNCISYNTGKSALPDIYARCLRTSANISLRRRAYISGKARVPVL